MGPQDHSIFELVALRPGRGQNFLNSHMFGGIHSIEPLSTSNFRCPYFWGPRVIADKMGHMALG